MNTSKMLAKYIANNNLKKVKFLLIKSKYDLNYQNHLGDSFLMIALMCNSSYRLIKFLLNCGIAVNLENNYKENAFLIACKYSNVSILKLLLKYDADCQTRNYENQNSIILAADCNNYKVISYLIEKSLSNINSLDNFGCNALHYVAKYNYTKTAKILLNNNINYSIKNKEYFSPLALAAEFNNIKVIKIINKHIKNNGGKNE